MKKIATWLTAGVIVATAAAGCSVEVTQGDGGTSSTGGTGGSGGSGGSTGGSAGTGGTAGSATAGSGGTAGDDAGTGGSGGSGGSGGTAGSAGSGGSDGGTPMCMANASDPSCTRCAFNNCMMEACACGANSGCRAAMIQFNTCIGMPNANLDACAQTFVVNANVDGGGGLANDLASCMADKCFDTCQSMDGGGGG